MGYIPGRKRGLCQVLKDSHLVVIKLNEKKNMTIRTVPKSNRKIVKTEAINSIEAKHN